MAQDNFSFETFLISMGRSVGPVPPRYFATENWSLSPYINHFLSADTIVPGYANPQSLNRYSYVLNNPLRYTDPTGHRPDDGCRTGEGCNVTGQTIIDDNKRANDFRQTTERNKCKTGNKDYCSGWSNVKDRFVWRSIPSAFGIDFGISGQSGLVMEYGVTPIDIQILYNWRSDQLTIFKSGGTNAYLGSPTLAGGNGYIGITTVYGASDNKYMAGDSRYGGITIQADVVGKAGISKTAGYSANVENGIPLPFIDPVSNISVTFRETNVTGGANLFPDGLDIGVFGGQSYSEIITSWP